MNRQTFRVAHCSLSELRLILCNSRLLHLLLRITRSKMRRPGIEPGLLPWEANVLPLDHRRSLRSPCGQSRFARLTIGALW